MIGFFAVMPYSEESHVGLRKPRVMPKAWVCERACIRRYWASFSEKYTDYAQMDGTYIQTVVGPSQNHVVSPLPKSLACEVKCSLLTKSSV
jgi:hypothetical protein